MDLGVLFPKGGIFPPANTVIVIALTWKGREPSDHSGLLILVSQQENEEANKLV